MKPALWAQAVTRLLNKEPPPEPERVVDCDQCEGAGCLHCDDTGCMVLPPTGDEP